MVSADVLKGIWQDIVTRHIADVGFSSEWVKILDQNTEVDYPVALWLTFGPSSMPLSAEALMMSHTVTLMFLDRTRNDRTADERDLVVSRMGIIAAQCWARFVALYVLTDSNTWEGEPVHLDITSPPVFTSVSDTTGLNLSGVTMTATVQSTFGMDCVNTMFN